MNICLCTLLTLANLSVGAIVLSGSLNETTSPTDHQACSREDILIAQLSVSELNNKITQQKHDVCQLGTQVIKLQKNVESLPRSGINTIKEILEEISTLTRAQGRIENELTSQRSTLQLQQATIEQIQKQTVDTTVQDCPDGYIRNERSCYKFYDTKLNWIDSLTHCKVFGSHLVVINTTSELSFLQTKLEELRDIYSMTIFWIAATDAVVEGEWIWVESGKPANIAWKPGQPNDYKGQDCAALTGDGGYKAEDKSCRSIYHHICEIELQ